MTEKYNIPKVNSLDSMEGIEKNELNEEDLSSILSRVEDIFQKNKNGVTSITAFMDVPLAWRLKSVLKLGLLGSSYRERKRIYDRSGEPIFECYDEFEHYLKDNWKLDAESKDCPVWFNPVWYFSKKSDDDDDVTPFRSHRYDKIKLFNRGVAVIFGMDDYEEKSALLYPLAEEGGDSTFGDRFKKSLSGMKRRDYKRKEERFFYDMNQVKEKLLSEKIDSFYLYAVMHFLGIVFESMTIPQIVDKIRENEDSLLNTGVSKQTISNLIAWCLDRGNFSEIHKTISLPPDEGLVVRNRIAPRKFKGFVVEDKDGEVDNLINEIIKQQFLSKKEDSNFNFLPIYDTEGNLLWPKKIFRKEIVKMKAGSEQK